MPLNLINSLAIHCNYSYVIRNNENSIDQIADKRNIYDIIYLRHFCGYIGNSFIHVMISSLKPQTKSKCRNITSETKCKRDQNALFRLDTQLLR